MFPKRFAHQYTKALVIGTWGGNDIVSATIAVQKLAELGISADLAGILSPWAIHTNAGQPEQCVQELTGSITRQIASKIPKKLSFVDTDFPLLVRQQGLPIEHIYDFSLRFGTERLHEAVQTLIQSNGYDLIVGVDVGGDILARWPEDHTILSPQMDFGTLQLLSTLQAEKTVLVEFGLGTDGELRPEGMHAIIDQLKKNKLITHTDTLSAYEPAIAQFRPLYDQVKRIRAGNTVRMTLATLDTATPDTDITFLFTLSAQLHTHVGQAQFPVVLPHAYFGKTYMMDVDRLSMSRPLTHFSFSSLLEQFVKLKTLQPLRKTESDLCYLRSDDNRTTPHSSGSCLQLLTPSVMLSDDDRKKIVALGIQQLHTKETDLALLMRDDYDSIDHHWLICLQVNTMVLCFTDKTLLPLAERTAAHIAQRQDEEQTVLNEQRTLAF